MARTKAGTDPLPALAVLAAELGVHSSTVFRILCDMSMEGLVWHAPNGRFHPARARKSAVRGLPVCFIGREMRMWSRLYQEILEGVSEACAPNKSNLVLCSSPSLVKQETPLEKPRFASEAVQHRELRALLENAPGNCCGFIFDHLWSPQALASSSIPSGAGVQLFRDCGSAAAAAVDFPHGARLVAKLLASVACSGVALVVPFTGDCAIEADAEALEKELSPKWPLLKMDHAAACRRARELVGRGFVFVCTEDNDAAFLSGRIASFCRRRDFFPLVATQGTGLPTGPASRLRYDFQALGRSSAAMLIYGAPGAVLRPKLVSPILQAP